MESTLAQFLIKDMIDIISDYNNRLPYLNALESFFEKNCYYCATCNDPVLLFINTDSFINISSINYNCNICPTHSPNMCEK